MNGELQVTRLYRRVVRGRLVLEYDERPGRAAPPLAAPGRAAPGRAR